MEIVYEARTEQVQKAEGSVMYCCAKNHLRIDWFKTMTYSFSWFCGSGIQGGLGWAVHLLLVEPSCCEVTSWAGRVNPKEFHSRAWPLGAPPRGQSLATWLGWVSSQHCGLSRQLDFLHGDWLPRERKWVLWSTKARTVPESLLPSSVGESESKANSGNSDSWDKGSRLYPWMTETAKNLWPLQQADYMERCLRFPRVFYHQLLHR